MQIADHYIVVFCHIYRFGREQNLTFDKLGFIPIACRIQVENFYGSVFVYSLGDRKTVVIVVTAVVFYAVYGIAVSARKRIVDIFVFRINVENGSLTVLCYQKPSAVVFYRGNFTVFGYDSFDKPVRTCN